LPPLIFFGESRRSGTTEALGHSDFERHRSRLDEDGG
jgi:hypothetical protein